MKYRAQMLKEIWDKKSKSEKIKEPLFAFVRSEYNAYVSECYENGETPETFAEWSYNTIEVA